MRRPLVGVLCDYRMEDGTAFHRAGDEYVRAIAHGAHAIPLLIPATKLPPEDVLARVDGLLFTGSPSNVEPAQYGGPASRPGTLADPARDAVSLPLLRAAIAAGKPVFCICRGFQELNVALGGTLNAHVHQGEGALDHREDESAALEVQYGPAHDVNLTPGGFLAGLLQTDQISVNSLHHQGIARLAPGLAVEATAPDGLIEAVSLAQAKGFLLGVQWHPEWNVERDPVSRALFAAFGKALAVRP